MSASGERRSGIVAMYNPPIRSDLPVAATLPEVDTSTIGATRAKTHRSDRVRSVVDIAWSPKARGLAAITAICTVPVVATARYVETESGTWFATLPKHGLVRTEWLFGWVTVALYALLAVAAWLVWRRDWPEPDRRRALAVMGLQVLVATTWTPVLFASQSLDIALLVAAAMWLVTLGMLTTVAPANWFAAILATPMFAWATYAVVVNATLVIS